MPENARDFAVYAVMYLFSIIDGMWNLKSSIKVHTFKMQCIHLSVLHTISQISANGLNYGYGDIVVLLQNCFN